MIPAQPAHRIDDVVHLPERHSVHLLVELIEVRTDMFIVVEVVSVNEFV